MIRIRIESWFLKPGMLQGILVFGSIYAAFVALMLWMAKL